MCGRSGGWGFEYLDGVEGCSLNICVEASLYDGVVGMLNVGMEGREVMGGVIVHVLLASHELNPLHRLSTQ